MMMDEQAEQTGDEKKTPTHTDWHVLLGGVQQPLLTPVEITVETELLATQKPPRIDILLLRRKGKFWTPEQQARLPDGIRQSYANHILCEFKYTQSVNKATLVQALLYDQLYRMARNLKRQAVQTFVVSARTPQRDVLAHFGYTADRVTWRLSEPARVCQCNRLVGFKRIEHRTAQCLLQVLCQPEEGA